MSDQLLPWRLCEELTIPQICMLLCGVPPTSTKIPLQVDGWNQALRQAILRLELPVASDAQSIKTMVTAVASHEQKRLFAYLGSVSAWINEVAREPDSAVFTPFWQTVKLKRAEIKTWLSTQGIASGFFFDEERATIVEAPPSASAPLEPEPTPQAKETENSSKESGVTISLPHMNKALEAVFRIMRDNWTHYDPKNPPKQTNIADELDAALGWEGSADGPSRNAKAIATLIQPDTLPRKIRRRT